MTCDFLIQLVFCEKEVVYWCWSKTWDAIEEFMLKAILAFIHSKIVPKNFLMKVLLRVLAVSTRPFVFPKRKINRQWNRVEPFHNGQFLPSRGWPLWRGSTVFNFNFFFNFNFNFQWTLLLLKNSISIDWPANSSNC